VPRIVSNCHNSCPQLKSPLINHLINDRQLRLTNSQSDVASTHRHLAKTADRPALVALQRFYIIHRTNVWDVRKPAVLCYEELRCIVELDGCARTMHLCAVILNLKLVLCFRFY